MSRMEMIDLTGLREVLPLMILLSRDTSHVNREEYRALDIASLASKIDRRSVNAEVATIQKPNS
jgi:hypothetical protein